MATIPTIRVGVDWDGDGVICYNAVPTDPLNLIPSPITMHTLDTTGINGNVGAMGIKTMSVGDWLQFFGKFFISAAISSGTDDGFAIGQDGSGTINDIAITASTQYTLSFYIRRTFGLTLPLVVTVVNQAGSTITSTNVSLTGSFGNWTRVSVTFTTGVSDTHIALRIIKDSSATTTSLYVSGIMLTVGAILYAFNSGHPFSRYENLTSYTMSFSTKSGYSKWTDNMMSEGTANIQLVNTDRLFSPEYASSPLFGAFINRKKVEIAVQNPSTLVYTVMWTGWTEEINVSPKKYGDNSATLTCSQGRFQLDKVPFRQLIAGTYTADQVINQVLEAGYVSAYRPFQTIFDQTTFADAVFEDPLTLYDINTGLTSLTVSGENWGADVKGTRIIDDILQIERGWFFIDRLGRVCFHNRRVHVKDVAPAPITLSIDTEASGGTYNFGEDFVNKVRVSYSPKNLKTQLIWESRESIEVPKRSDKEVKARLEYTEGKKLTVNSVNSTTASPNPSVITVTRTDKTTAVTALVDVTWTVENGEVTLKIVNDNSFAVLVNAELWGQVTESYSGRVVELFLEDGFGDGIIEMVDQSKLITNEDIATDYGNYLLATFGAYDGIFSNVTLKTRNSTWLQKQLDIEISDLITLTEYQTSHDADYIVIGENLNWTPGLLTSTYNLAPQTKLDYHFLVETTQLDTNSYYGY